MNEFWSKQAEQFPVGALALWFEAAGIRGRSHALAEQHQLDLMKACYQFLATSLIDGMPGGHGASTLKKDIRKLARSAREISAIFHRLIREGGRRGHADTPRGHAARDLWKIVAASLMHEILYTKDLEPDMLRRLINHVGGYKLQTDNQLYAGADLSLPIAIKQ